MGSRDFMNQIEGIERIRDEMIVCRKYGIDYTVEKGRASRLMDLLHPRVLRLRVNEVVRETATASTLRMVPVDGYLPPFQAGQYINLFVEKKGVRTSRPYSISSAPHQTGYYDITVRRVENGFVSDILLDSVKPGDEFESTSPAGNFYFNPLFHEKSMVCLAGGSGVTPFMSMIRDVTDRGLDRTIHLIYGSRGEDDIIFHGELKDRAARHVNFIYTPVISEPSKSCRELTGFITAELMRKVLRDTASKTYYICGPSGMYDFCMPELEKIGIPARRVRREMFGPPRDITAEPGWPEAVKGSAEFKVAVRGGKTVKAKAGEPVLTALERAGMVVPALCRCGECSMCRMKLLSGKVFQPRGVLLRKSDRDAGYIHSCAAYPLTDLEIMI